MEKTFTLRVDLESSKGIREGLPPLLDLLKKYEIKASFYLVMGGESNIFEILKYRGGMAHSSERKIKIWSFWEKLRMALFPKDFVTQNKEVLKRILEEGHELGIHGWKHRAWTRGLDKININEHIEKAIEKYKGLFGKNPISFAAPGFNTNMEIMISLIFSHIKFVSDLPGSESILNGGIINVPMTICGENRTPIIEYLVSLGNDDDEVLELMKLKILERDLSSFYIHGLYEARFKLDLLERIFKFIKEEGIKTKRIIDY